MRILLLTFLVFLNTVAIAQEPDIAELRQLLTNGTDNRENGLQFYEKIGSYSGDNALFLSYKAAAYAIKAKYTGNPFKKLKLIKTSSSIFSDAVSRDDQNVEIRYIRYVVETRTPAKVKLSQHLDEDKNILIQAIRDYPKSGIAPDLAGNARDFIKRHCTCSEDEVKALDGVKLE